jgi:LmbE family N-acetylglucosaminyl deacetylase
LDETPAVVAAIYAHPDDAEISCGGTLAKWVAAGAEVHLLICTLGDKGAIESDTDVDLLVRERALEVEGAAKVLGLSSVQQLDRRDGEFENDLELRGELVKFLRIVRPDAVVCPDPLAVFFGDQYYNHRDHRIAGWTALDAMAPAAASPLYFPDAGAPHAVRSAYLSGSLEANLFVDVSTTIDVKAEAVLCHRSQLGTEPDWLRSVVFERAAEAGREAGLAFAEGFRRVQLAR